MTDGDALLAAIRANPDEDVPRLAYADWLTENGRAEEGEFIRVQCRLASAGPDDPEYPELLTREEELKLWLASHDPRKLEKKPRGGLSLDDGSNWWKYSRRGFPRYIELKGSSRARGTFARAASVAIKKLFARVPTRWLSVGAVSPGQLADLLREPVIGQLERLNVWTLTASEEQADEMGRVLAAAPHVRDLRGFFPDVWFGESAIEALSRTEFTRLQAFKLNAGRVDAAAMRTLARAPWFKRLRELYIDSSLTDETYHALLAAGPFPHLHTVALSRQTLSVASWEAFAKSKAFPKLSQLDLTHTDLTRGRMAVLAKATGLALHILELEACVIGNDGAAALAQASWADSLRVLNLRMNRLTAGGFRTLAESPRLANLRILKCGGNSPGVGGFKSVAASPHLRHLISLELDYHDESARQLVTVAHGRNFLSALAMSDLRELRIHGLTLGPAGATILSTHPQYANLTRLKLTYCGLGDAGAAELIAAPQLQNMIELNLTQNGITDGVKALADPRVMPRLSVCDLRNNFMPAELLDRIKQRGCLPEF